MLLAAEHAGDVARLDEAALDQHPADLADGILFGSGGGAEADILRRQFKH
jgi:hypothetical protein